MNKIVWTVRFLIVLLTVGILTKIASAQARYQTQVVAQWIIPNETGLVSGISAMRSCADDETKIAKHAGNVFTDDGNDIGSGTCNIYLYTTRVADAVKILINLESTNVLRPGLRVGVAKYINRDHTDWTYEAVYPAGLTHFDVIYPSQSSSATKK